MPEDKIIFPESYEAAKYVTNVTGWISREGRFYGNDEQAARWGGATHIHCKKCGAPTFKPWLLCKKCRDQQAWERYAKFPTEKWDENVPTYSPVTDRYYWYKDDVRDENSEGNFDPASLQLVLCKPIYAPDVDPESIYEDLLPEYDKLSDVSQELVDAFQELNDTIKDANIILSYEPIDVAVI